MRSVPISIAFSTNARSLNLPVPPPGWLMQPLLCGRVSRPVLSRPTAGTLLQPARNAYLKGPGFARTGRLWRAVHTKTHFLGEELIVGQPLKAPTHMMYSY